MAVFRQKNLDKLSSPDQLDNYIRVVSPGVWMAIGAVALVILAVVVWAFLGEVDGVTPFKALFG